MDDTLINNKLSTNLTLHQIVSLDDPQYDAWLDLYQQSFPLSEQVLVSELNRSLRNLASRQEQKELFWAAINSRAELAGMARCDLYAGRVAWLWYIAVQPNLRSQGIGTWLYQTVVEEARRLLGSSAEAVIFEVEPSEHSASGQPTDAERRIAFYRRNGARLLTGIRYMQSVGWQPPMPMSVVLHPLASLSPRQAFEIAKAVFGDALEQTGELQLT